MADDIVIQDSGKITHLPRSAWRTARTTGQLSFYAEVANQAAGMVCGLYGKSPSSFLRVQPLNSGFLDNSKGVLDDLCQDVAPPPPDPAPPFSGGQCPTQYNLTCTTSGYVINNGVREDRRSTVVTLVTGDILSTTTRDVGAKTGTGVPGARSIQIIAICKGSQNPISFPAPPGYQAALVGGNGNFAYESHSISVARVDGQADSCGNPAPAYPPISTNPEDYSRSISFPISPTVSVPVDVSIAPTVVISPGTFNPEFNVNVGGINVNISAGGFTFSPTVEIPVGVSFPIGDPRSVKPPSVGIKPPNRVCADDIDVLEILKRIKNVQEEVERCCDRDNPFEPPDANKVITTVLGAGGGGLYDLPRRTFQVVVSLTAIAGDGKRQPGFASPDVLYAGWAWFGAANNMSERMPIDSEFKIYSPKPWISNTFGFTVYTGYTATVTAYSIAE